MNSISNTLIHQCRRVLQRRAWLLVALMLLMILVQSARGYSLAGNKMQFVQLCTAQGMVNVSVERAPVATDMLSMHNGGDCCGCCAVALGAPPVILTVEKTYFSKFIIAVSTETVQLPTAFYWSPARPQPPPVVSPQSDVRA